MHGLLEVIQALDVLVGNALDSLGRDTLGLWYMKVVRLAVDIHSLDGSGQLVGLATAGVVAIKWSNINRRPRGSWTGRI